MDSDVPALLALNRASARTLVAVFERLFPADEVGPGATGIGAWEYVDRALVGAYHEHAASYRLGLAALNRAAHQLYGTSLHRRA